MSNRYVGLECGCRREGFETASLVARPAGREVSCVVASRGYGHGHRVLCPESTSVAAFFVHSGHFILIFGGVWLGTAKGERSFGLTWVALGGLGDVTEGFVTEIS